ncbi:hypothetical protein MMC22_006895 [Lobaria immixta]|nr:hypothetical protein [Lobaria immixta]
MQLQSTVLFVASLLAATNALPGSQPKKYEVGEQAVFPGVTAKIRGWAKQQCPAKDKPSYYQEVNQQTCYQLEKTEFLSYKLWQPVHTTAAWQCTFTLYEDVNCNDFYVAPSSLPSTEKKATCDDGLRHFNPDTNQLEGFRSLRFVCECSDFYGCTLPKGH